MTKRDKTTVDDIIGIVHTDEPTDSVEEVCKLHGRENRTKKRYYCKDYEESYYVFDSKTLSESEFEENVEYYGYNVFADSLTGEEVVDLLNENEQLKQENKELRQDNDIKFWKHQFMTQHNRTQLILHELRLAMNEGYEVSDKFKEWLGDLREKNKEVITKHERLFE